MLKIKIAIKSSHANKAISFSLINFGSDTTTVRPSDKKVNPKAVTLLDSNLVKSIIQMIHSETVKKTFRRQLCHHKIPQGTKF